MNRREAIFSIAATFGYIAASGRVFAQTENDLPVGYDQIIEASKSEGPITIYSSFGEEFWPFVLKALNAKYPWIKVNYLDLNVVEAVQRYLIESSAKSQTADMMVFASPEDWHNLSQRDEVLKHSFYQGSQLPAWANAAPGVYSLFVDAEIFAWNKRLLDPALVPTGLQDFAEKVAANPDVFKGRIVTKSALLESNLLLSLEGLERQHGENLWKWLDIIGPNAQFETSNGAIIEKLLSGEYLVCMGLTTSRCIPVMRDPASAALFDWGYMRDGTIVSPRQAGIMKAAQNPNSAKLLLDTMLSKDGQIAIGLADKMPLRADIATGELPPDHLTYQMIVEKIGSQNTLQTVFDPASLAGRQALIERYSKAFNIKS